MKRSNRFVSVGIVSLLLIFSVFCMVILSLLTYHTSHSDFSSAQQALELTSAYYETCTKVTELTLDLNQKIKELSLSMSKDEETLLSAIPNMVLPAYTNYDSSQKVFSIAVPFSETQELYVELTLHISSETDTFLSTKTWTSRLIGTWNPNLHQNVYLKGESE